MVQSFGYPIEEHEVITQDGYILKLHRIPHGLKNNEAQETKRQPVILAHCLLGSSAVFAYGPTNNSLAYMLADEGKIRWICIRYIMLNTYVIFHRLWRLDV